MIAALPMYDRAETAPANDRLWALIRDRLRDQGISAPDALTRHAELQAIWTDPKLLLGETCGMPFRRLLHDRVDLVGTPVRPLPDCPAGYYRSVIIARAPGRPGHFRRWRGARLAVNERGSQSGYAAPQTHAAICGFRFDDLVLTGSHRASARAVALDQADLAALDAVSWAMMRRWDRQFDGLIEVARTLPTPGLPFVTARGGPVTALAEAVTDAIAGLDPADRNVLMIDGFTRIPADDYRAVPTPP